MDTNLGKQLQRNKKNCHLKINVISYETSDGISRSEEAEIKNQGSDNEILVVRGTVSWVAPDGVRYTISFISDENGET